jgi:AhpD family alkylhydroperoxidase
MFAMTQRIDYAQAFPEAIRAMGQMEASLRNSGLEKSLLDLVKLRASQLNGCAYCIDRHTKDARSGGEAEQRLYGLVAWRESPFFTARERAAMSWTEAITNIQEGHATQAAYDDARKEFDEAELVKLTFAITAINTWNRIAIAFRPAVGVYQPEE